ncbi:MAG TPA: DNA mismatch repair protein MutS [Kiritimatiellia bacterium]|nr:DNA mismatch repair protein MutS [Kiritimatiellia bacterium]
MSDTLTPMMQQYRRIRSELPPDTLLFFRLGDFYEMFFDDAKTAAGILDIALTRRHHTPMCGIPYHAADSYLAKIIRAGKKVAICEQMEDPAQAKGIVRREVTRVITPGTVLQDAVLQSDRNNWLAGLCRTGELFGLALLDLSTGSFWIEESSSPDALRENMLRYSPSECLVPEEQAAQPEVRAMLERQAQAVLTPYEDWTFDAVTASDFLKRHFQVHSLEGFGCETCKAGISAAGAVLHYVTSELHVRADHIRQVRRRNPDDFMLLDESTAANLDLVECRGRRVAGAANTLLGVLDATKTAMGGRLLREWVLRPLNNLDRIQCRHEAVQTLHDNWPLLQDLRETLALVRDMERIIARLSAGGGNARDIRALAASLSALPHIRSLAAGQPVPALAEIGERIRPLPELVDEIEKAIVDEPPIPIKEGGIIRRGYHDELDELRSAATEGRNWLAEFQQREQDRTGIKSLKIRHNKVFGYYIEVTKSNLNLVPENYIRKQTMVNAERFITPELKEYENKILGAQDRAMALEYELFVELRERCTQQTAVIQETAAAVAELDILAGFADRAHTLRYVRPQMTAGDALSIRDGRHPVIEQMPDAERFVPNDTILDNGTSQLIIITGPNMAGKSTYIRQVALIVIMAHIGSFVPAGSAEIGLTDRVFTRVGASDDLTRGRSTFMVEMQETANILNNATPKSLIVLDEIGRGTSTFDGISIAWAVAEHLHNHPAVKAKTLFATHYHELTDLALTMAGVKNYNVLVREKGDHIVFLRKIVPGGAAKSFGIQVARLAGLPDQVIERAKEILANLEEGELGETGQPKIAKHGPRKPRASDSQLNLFDPGM